MTDGGVDKTLSQRLVRLRVPLSWGLGLLALYLARPTPMSYVFGTALAGVGEALRIWAAGHLVRGDGLTRSGPYSWTRNPLYLGSTLLGIGFSIVANRWELWLLFGILLVGVFLPVIRAEADHLARRFPEIYGAYAEAVPLFIPRMLPQAGPWNEKRFCWDRVLTNREHLTVLGCIVAAALLGLKLALVA